MEKKNKKSNAQGRRCLGIVEVSPYKKRLRRFFPRAMFMLRETARKTEYFPEQAIAMGLSLIHI